MTDPHSIPRPAATVILARDTEEGPEVFMMKRTTEVTFAKGMHVFPGGALDAADRQMRDDQSLYLITGDDRQRFGNSKPGLSHELHWKLLPKKRTEEEDVRFAQSFEKMLMMVQEKFQKNTKTMEKGRKENK